MKISVSELGRDRLLYQVELHRINDFLELPEARHYFKNQVADVVKAAAADYAKAHIDHILEMITPDFLVAVATEAVKDMIKEKLSK